MANINPSPWHIGTKRIAEKTFYNVYRNLDEDLCDTEDNREYRGGLYDRLYDAEALARTRNTEEAITVSDNEIRSILIERKRKARKAENRSAILEAVGTIIAWAGLLFLCFMISVIGG